MVNGLKAAVEDPHCRIDMNTYGFVCEKICFGCAATYAIRYLTGVKLKEIEHLPGMAEDRYRLMGMDIQDVDRFEYAVDWLRSGKVKFMFQYLDMDVIEPFVPLPYLNDDLKGLEEYEKYGEYLKSLDL